MGFDQLNVFEVEVSSYNDGDPGNGANWFIGVVAAMDEEEVSVGVLDQVKLFDATPVYVRRPDREDLKVGAADIAKAITPRTRVLILNSPSNPTGAVYSRSELEEIAEAKAEIAAGKTRPL